MNSCPQVIVPEDLDIFFRNEDRSEETARIRHWKTLRSLQGWARLRGRRLDPYTFFAECRHINEINERWGMQASDHDATEAPALH